jgi:hypothetical protein
MENKELRLTMEEIVSCKEEERWDAGPEGDL